MSREGGSLWTCFDASRVLVFSSGEKEGRREGEQRRREGGKVSREGGKEGGEQGRREAREMLKVLACHLHVNK